MLAQPAISLRIVEIARQITHPLSEPSPCGLYKFVEMKLAITSDMSFHCTREMRAPLLRAHLGQVDANETKFFRQLVIVCQVVECGYNETLRQIPGCTKNHHRAGRCHGGARGLLRCFSSSVATWPV